MVVITRRGVVTGLGGLAATTVGLGGYALGIEPMWRLVVRHYQISPPAWPSGLKLRVAVVADLHAGEPQMPARRIEEIVDRTNRIGADVIVLLGDYAASHKWQTRRLSPKEWALELGGLKAPLGVPAVLGNHDWWDDYDAQRAKRGPVIGRRSLEARGIPVYENDVVRLQKDGQAFWIAGLADQIAFWKGRQGGRALFQGLDDLPATLGRVTDDAPVILLAHEPDIFPTVPARVALTISGHTHGGQVRVLGWSPYVPSQYRDRYAYGHIVEDGRHLLVSGGLGCSIVPVRFGVPPEIVAIDLA
jgi:uncharacterized protein